MSSKEYKLFIDSMVMDFDKWHDGIGYDLKMLEKLGAEERASIEKLLIGNLKQEGDWRDVDALTALGTTSARAAVDKARFHNITKVRDYALKIILSTPNTEGTTKKDIAELEDQVVQAVKRGNYEIAEYMPTMRVKKTLLDSIPGFISEIRVSAVAFLLYLCGQALEPFDWSQRPFFLLFSDSERDPKIRQQAWEHLRKRTGL